MTQPVTVRIGTLVVEGAAGGAHLLSAALRDDLARRIAAGATPPNASIEQIATAPLGAATPAGRGRELAGRIVGNWGRP